MIADFVTDKLSFDKRLPIEQNLKQLNKIKAVNETSTSPAKLREPGKVRAGVSAEAEWTREPQTERPRRVGFDGTGTVNRAQGIAVKSRT